MNYFSSINGITPQFVLAGKSVVLRFSLATFLVMSCLVELRAQEEDVPAYIVHPRWDSSRYVMASVGTSVTFVPRPIAEEEIRQIPMIDVDLRWNMLKNIALKAHAGSNYITNIASLGAQWSTTWGQLTVGVGDDLNYWYGIASMEAFDVHAVGWLNTPHIMVGWSASEMLISLRAEMIFLTSRSTRVGSIEVASDRNQRLGTAVAVYVEQPFAGKTHIVLGLKVNNLKNAYQSWLAFSTFKDPLLYPELSVGVLL